MDLFYIQGGNKLDGDLSLYPAKNALLPILAGAIVCDDVVVIKKCSRFSDVMFMVKILESLGADAKFENDDLILNLKNASSYEVPEEYTKKVRSSIFMLGSLLSRFKMAKVAYPGGCNIGTRPIDLHLKGLRSLNVKIEEEDGFIICDGSDMKADEVYFEFPSVGATENIMMASVFLKGTTHINNAAREPEIVDLQDFLNSMGAKISGAGTSIITIEGVDELHSTEYTPISDRIVTGTYLIACAAIQGKITLKNANHKHNLALLKYLKQAGCKIKVKDNEITISNFSTLRNIKKIETRPYPGFATDLQSPLLAMQTIGKGTGTIVENLYETRYKIVPELIKMGANISIKDRTAIIKGVKSLQGADVVASDLRAGAGLVIAGLSAEGETRISDIENIERGYLNIDKDLSSLGANIKRISTNV